MPEFDFLDEAPPQPKPPVREKRPRKSPLLRVAVIFGVIVIVLVTSVPFALASFAGHRVRFFSSTMNTRVRMLISEVMRPYVLPADSTITPMQAGTLAASLLGPESDSLFPLTKAPRRIARPWMDEDITPEMFATARPREDKNLPAFTHILVAAASEKLSKDEMDFLERVAHAPLWKDVETVGRAHAIDFIGARFALPFPHTASYLAFPIPHFSVARDIAHAGVSRAAYYLANGKRDSAEHALRVVDSFGFAMMDNATSVIQNLIGAVVVGVGRSALVQLDSISGNPRGTSIRRQADSIVALYKNALDTSRVNTREEIIAALNNPATPRPVRFELLGRLAMLPCLSARGVLLGARSDVDSAFERAKHTLARFPSEVALVDLIEHTSERPMPLHGVSPNTDMPGIVIGAASFASGILRTRRPSSCTELLAVMR